MPSEDADQVLPGFKLRHILRGHSDAITRIAWSPDARILASPSRDGTVQLWDWSSGTLLRALGERADHAYNNWWPPEVYCAAWSSDGQTLATGASDGIVRLWDSNTGVLLGVVKGHDDVVTGLAWSPNGQLVASASDDRDLKVWEVGLKTLYLYRTLEGHSDWVTNVAWSPDGRTLASSSGDGTIKLWDVETGRIVKTLYGHFGRVTNVIWSPTGRMLASTSVDRTVRLWNPQMGKETNILEGHALTVRCVSFSSDERLLASKSWDGTVRIWQCDTWKTIAAFGEAASSSWAASLAFHPKAPILVTLGEFDRAIRIWELDLTLLLDATWIAPSIQYTNAKVALVGDTGVGKTGLARVLSGQPFVPTESTHGRHVWTFESGQDDLGGGRKQMHETFLWDLAGQPGYRLIHQLHLNEVAVALVVFDARSETDPFAGVRHWDRALRQARRLQGGSAPPMKKFLVAARTDRGGISVSRERIETFVRELEFDGYYETSAKEGWGTGALTNAIRWAINWEMLPRVSSSELFQRIKAFLIEEKQSGRLLSMVDDLHHTFLRSSPHLVPPPCTREGEGGGELRTQFETCIGRVESRGLIQRLNFGHLVLLQPELLDAYASALVNAARDEPDGLGCIREEDALAGCFRIPQDERIKDKAQEKLLLIATVEDLLAHEIALREEADLVLPSQLTRERPDLPDPTGKAVTFEFEGPVLNVYATLAVRLSHSGVFKKHELWKNAATYTATVGGKCGVSLCEVEEGRGELTLFFDDAASEETRFQFEEFIRAHLERRALPDSIKRRRVFVCGNCGTPLTDLMVSRRRERGFNWIECNVCGEHISLLDREERLAAVRPSLVPEMDRAADAGRERQTAASILQGKIATSDFDVFLCHNSADKAAVKIIGELLKERGILPWLDEWELRPGQPWQKALEKQIKQIESAAVFVGKNGVGPWQDLEQEAFIRQFVKRGCPVIPVILADCEAPPELPVFLEGMTWIDFRKQTPDPMQQLIWGITGERGGRPVRSEEPASPIFAPEQVDRVKLRQILVTYFNASELRALCFDLHIDYENLAGETKEDKARELVEHCERRGRTVELVQACRRLRPNALQ